MPPPLPPLPAPTTSKSLIHLTTLITSSPLPLLPSLFHQQLPLLSSSPLLLPHLLTHLLLSHSPLPKSLSLFLFSLHHLPFPPSPLSLPPLLHSLSRSRLFPSSLRLLRHLSPLHPHLLTPHSLSILLSHHANFNPYPSTISFFLDLRQIFAQANHSFTADHFVALLRAFSSHGRMREARAAFNAFHAQFPPSSKIFNTLLLGFKEAGNVLAFQLFYNEMVVRGFEPDLVTYNIRIDAYCKGKRFSDALQVFEDMERSGFVPNVQTMTTLVHGAGIARNPIRARKVFGEIAQRGLVADKGAYNALMGAVVRVGELGEGREVMREMEEKGIGVDDVSYYTMFCGLRKVGDLEGVCELYGKMVEKGFVPRVRTVMLLMKFFCERRRFDLGLGLWDYLVEKGCCPHRHALDLLVVGLCCSDRVEEAYRCFKQVVERERRPSERSVKVLEGYLGKLKEREKLDEMKKMMESLEALRMSQSTECDLEEIQKCLSVNVA